MIPKTQVRPVILGLVVENPDAVLVPDRSICLNVNLEAFPVKLMSQMGVSAA